MKRVSECVCRFTEPPFSSSHCCCRCCCAVEPPLPSGNVESAASSAAPTFWLTARGTSEASLWGCKRLSLPFIFLDVGMFGLCRRRPKKEERNWTRTKAGVSSCRNGDIVQLQLELFVGLSQSNAQHGTRSWGRHALSVCVAPPPRDCHSYGAGLWIGRIAAGPGNVTARWELPLVVSGEKLWSEHPEISLRTGTRWK